MKNKIFTLIALFVCIFTAGMVLTACCDKKESEKERYTIVVESTDGGTVAGDGGEFKHGDILSLTAQTQDGYTFLGWFKNDEDVAFSKDIQLIITVKENAKYTAKWMDCPLKVKFQVALFGLYDNYEYASFSMPTTTIVGEEVTLTATETSQLGYQFVGWYDSSFSATGKLLCDQLKYTFEMPSEETKLYIRYDKKEEMKIFEFNSTDTTCHIYNMVSDIDSNIAITIPDCVTSLSDGAFRAKSITSAVVGSGITEIPYQAFYGCKSLTTVEFKGNITSIGKMAFNSCNQLLEMTLPESVTAISEQAFISCSALTSITFGKNVASIGSYAFSSCSKLSNISTLEGVNEIGSQAFYGCSALTSLELPSIESIGENAFRGCSRLESVILGNKLTTLDTGAFSKTGLTSIVIPGSLKVVSTSAFDECYSLTSITIEEGVEKLDYYCFQFAPVTSVEIADSVKLIYRAFYNCSKLESITFGLGLNRIEKASFDGCKVLKSATFKNKEGWYTQSNVGVGGVVRDYIKSEQLVDPENACSLLLDTNTLEYWERKEI